MHPSDETLLSFASGEADLPQRALIEGHLGGCASCRVTVGELTLAGGALLRGAGGEAPPQPLWDRVLRRVEALRQPPPASPPAGRRQERPRFPLPDAVERELSELGDRRAVRWHWALTPGIWYADLARDPATGSALLGGYLPPGRRFPEHVHLGPENVLVLAGGYADHLGRYEAGEYAVYPPGSVHQPATDPDEGCWSLVRLEKPNLFLGWRGWVQRYRR